MVQCLCEAHLLQLFRDPHARVHSLSALCILGLVMFQEVASGQLGTHEPQERRLVCVLFNYVEKCYNIQHSLYIKYYKR